MRDTFGYTLVLKLYQYLMMDHVPSFLLKTVYGVELLIVLIFSSIFVGLLIRYVVFSIYTAFLIIHDCFRR
jgi:hypothetical protein